MEIRLWGAVSVVVDGCAERPAGGRAADLLACLAWQPGELIPDRTLADRIWGDALPEDPRDALYSCAKRLRRALAASGVDAGVLVRGRTGYILRADPDRVDVHRFRRLVRDAREADELTTQAFLYGKALSVAHGAPMAGFDSSWAERVRQALRRERLAAQLAAGSAWLRVGSHRELVTELTDLTVEHPLDEAVAGLLMEVLEQAGRPTEALVEFTRIRERLRGELGVEPGPGLRTRFERLLNATSVSSTLAS